MFQSKSIFLKFQTQSKNFTYMIEINHNFPNFNLSNSKEAKIQSMQYLEYQSHDFFFKENPSKMFHVFFQKALKFILIRMTGQVFQLQTTQARVSQAYFMTTQS